MGRCNRLDLHSSFCPRCSRRPGNSHCCTSSKLCPADSPDMAEPCPVNGSENPIVMRQYSNAAARMARAYVTSMRCVACPTREAHVLHSKRRLRRGTCRVYAARSSAGGTRACGYALGSVLSLNTGLVAAQFQVIFHPSTRLRRAAVSQRGEEGTDKIERSD